MTKVFRTYERERLLIIGISVADCKSHNRLCWMCIQCVCQEADVREINSAATLKL